jgi:hypothetical protein
MSIEVRVSIDPSNNEDLDQLVATVPLSATVSDCNIYKLSIIPSFTAQPVTSAHHYAVGGGHSGRWIQSGGGDTIGHRRCLTWFSACILLCLHAYVHACFA